MTIRSQSELNTNGLPLQSPLTPPGERILDTLLNDFTSPDERMTLPQAESVQPKPILLEHGKRLSESMLWKIQEQYYLQQGVDAWRQATPFLVTNSTVIAENYADLIITFLRDYQHQLDPSAPVYIMEISAGTGRFSFHLLKTLTRKLKKFSDLKDLKIQYIMTDCVDKNIAFWQQHDKLRPYIESGMLDFARFWPENEPKLTLELSGKTLGAEDFKNPLIAMMNYIFDTVRHDLFRISNHKLQEGLVSLYRNLDTCKENDPIHIDQVVESVDYKPANRHYYPRAAWNKVLQQYCEEIADGSIIFPLGAMNCIRNLEILTDNHLMLIASDKGYVSTEDMLVFPHHTFARHGSFSYSVNFDAINKYITHEGGRFFRCEHHSLRLQTTCCLKLRQYESHFEGLSFQFSEVIEQKTPITGMLDLDALVNFFNPQNSNDVAINMMMGVMRSACYDPQLVHNCLPKITQSINHLSIHQRHDLLMMLEKAWDNYYFFHGECNLPFWINVTYYELGLYTESLRFIEITESLFGEHQYLFYLKAQNYEMMGQPDQAKLFYEQALAMQSDFEDAQKALNRLLGHTMNPSSN